MSSTVTRLAVKVVGFMPGLSPGTVTRTSPRMKPLAPSALALP